MNAEKLKPIEIGYGDEKYIFRQRMITIAEEDALDAKFAEINKKDPDRYDLEFRACKDALSEFAAEMPQRLVMVTDDPSDGAGPKKGEYTRKAIADGGSVSEALDAEFATRTVLTERIIRTAFNVFRSQMVPDIRFL